MGARERLSNSIKQYAFMCLFTVTLPCLVKWEHYFAQLNELKSRKLVDVACAFDIETTTLDCGQAIMYIWQLKIGDHIVVGRTWEDFTSEIERINDALGKRKLKIFVHNLSYEFQFLAGILPFADNSVKIIKSRKILSAKYKNIEFCCSYLLSNMSLDRWTKSLSVEHKAVGALDYSIQRFPHTILTWRELFYCIQDVISLTQAVRKQNEIWEDDLSSMPYTSTGYVRRESKQALRKGRDYCYEDEAQSEEAFAYLREAFRGGNTHANRMYVGKILDNVGSKDISSAYPAAMLQKEFPVGREHIIKKRGRMNMKKQVEKVCADKCAVFRVKIEHLELKRYEEPIPYIAVHKCRAIKKGVYDNGRVLECDSCECTFTNIDWEIVCEQYNFDYEVIGTIIYWDKGFLPQSYIDTVIDYYCRKTQLKGLDEYLYMKSKNKLNSLYGMLVQNPAGDSIEWLAGGYKKLDVPLRESLCAYKTRAVMDYQKGVWVTAICRRYLQEGINKAGNKIVYCDTDSIKHIGEVDLSGLELEHSFIALDKNLLPHKMGFFEDEGVVDQFITWGAKKYAYVRGDKLSITIAGVNKTVGAQELNRKGGLSAFKPGFIFKKGGGLELTYNDNPEVKGVIAGRTAYQITRNVAIRPSTYTVSITPEYVKRLEEISAILLDKNKKIMYTTISS